MTERFASCWWLQDHIELSYDGKVHACCYGYPKQRKTMQKDRVNNEVTWEEVGHVPLCDVVGDKFPAEAIRIARDDLHRQIAEQRAEAEVCLECPVLKTRAWPPQQYLVNQLTLNTWLHCNLKCFYCFVANPNFKASKVKYNLHAVIDDMLKGEHLNPAGSVTWGGGDISALVEFDEVCELFVAYGVKQMIKTSAFKYLKGVSQVLETGLGTVEVSVDAGTAETYAQIKGKDAYDRVTENLKQYAQHGDVQLKYIATKDNLDDRNIDGFVELAQVLKTKSVMVTPEWTQCHNGEYNDQHHQQIAKLIGMLRATASVAPVNDDDGARLFPNGMWNRVMPYLNPVPAE